LSLRSDSTRASGVATPEIDNLGRPALQLRRMKKRAHWIGSGSIIPWKTGRAHSACGSRGSRHCFSRCSMRKPWTCAKRRL